MIDRLEELGLEADRIRHQRDVSANIGRLYLGTVDSRESTGDWEMRYFAAATNFRRAAANSLLLGETERAIQLFHSAASAYLNAGSAYGPFLENLGKEETYYSQFQEKGPRDGQDVFLLLSPAAIGDGRKLQKEKTTIYRQQLDGYRTQRVGILGFRVETYLQIFDALSWPESGSTSDMVKQALFPLLAAYTTAIEQCRSDHYHWRRMATAFHPAEPDVMATMVAMDRVLGDKGISLRGIIGTVPMSSEALQLMDGTLKQYRRGENLKMGDVTTD
jgi:hypothetical protein